MTNEEIATKIESVWAGTDSAIARQSAYMAAKMKDQQLREYLEDRLDSLKNYCVGCRNDDFYEGMVEMLDEIINELFKED